MRAILSLSALAVLAAAGAAGCKGAPGDGRLPVPAAERQKMIAALDAVDGGDRAMMAWAVIKEAGVEAYGAELGAAAAALPAAPPERRSEALVKALQPALHALPGCVDTLAAVAEAAPSARTALLLAGCPTGGGLLRAEQVRGAEPLVVLAALVMEHIARERGFAKDPLHLKTVAALLTPAP